MSNQERMTKEELKQAWQWFLDSEGVKIVVTDSLLNYYKNMNEETLDNLIEAKWNAGSLHDI